MSRIVTILIFRINYECCFTFKIIKVSANKIELVKLFTTK